MGGERRVQRLLEVGIARGTSADSTVSPGEVSFNPVPLRAGSRIGRCRLEEPIGRGSHGTVWRAIHEGTGRLVAVKLLRRDLLEGQALSRFHHEARILGRIRHPGVAQVLDHGMASGEEGAHAYHVLEFVEGVPLHEYGPDLSWREKLSVFVRVCDAVQAVHECGVIHRDLAPGNVLIQRDGQPKVIDFGLARAERVEVPERPWETASGSLLGTIAFASPEQVSGERELVGMRSDVYSLGAILHLWLTGRTPIDVDAPLHERLRRVREDTPRPPSYWRPELRGDVDAIGARALEKR
ncbi:MAG: serine/threonine protein kinase, partial [Planctomycetes bacterium]|nr:serine/threonine protein kinase [Planctomycetota bacterium]